MFVLLIGFAVAIAALWLCSPRGMGVHGAVSGMQVLDRPRFPFLGFFQDREGRRISQDKRMPVRVTGNSGIAFGIRNGDLLITKLHDDASRKKIKANDVVIINSSDDADDTPADFDRQNWRLRRIKALDNGNMDFNDGPDGYEFKAKPLADAVAWVEYINR